MLELEVADDSKLHDKDYKLFRLVCEIANFSKDPRTQTGALIVDKYWRPVSWGYNGLPRGCNDHEHLSDDERRVRFLHAEANAILTAQRPLDNCRIYTTLFPCPACASLIAQSRISKVVCPRPSREHYDRYHFDWSYKTFDELGIHVHLIRE